MGISTWSSTTTLTPPQHPLKKQPSWDGVPHWWVIWANSSKRTTLKSFVPSIRMAVWHLLGCVTPKSLWPATALSTARRTSATTWFALESVSYLLPPFSLSHPKPYYSYESEDDMAGPCTGDEGAPLVQDGYAVGIVSLQRDCGADPFYSSLYTRLSSYFQWIQGIAGLQPKPVSRAAPEGGKGHWKYSLKPTEDFNFHS